MSYAEAARRLYDHGCRPHRMRGPQSHQYLAIPADDHRRISAAIRSALRASDREMSAAELSVLCGCNAQRCAQIARHMEDVQRCEGDRTGKTYRMRLEYKA